MITDRCPRWARRRSSCRAAGGCWGGPSPGRACPPWSASWSSSSFFGVQAPGTAHPGGLASVLDSAALLGIGAVAVALLLIAGQFDLSIGVLAVASSLVTALLIEHAGWGTWPALAGVARPPRSRSALINGFLVVNTGLPSFLVTLATFLVLQGTSLAGAEAVAGSAGSPGWTTPPAGPRPPRCSARPAARRRPLPGLAAVVAGGRRPLATWALWRTRFGNAVFASGGARTAARQLGVPVRRTTLTLFCLTAAAGWLIGTLGADPAGRRQVGAPGLGTASTSSWSR